MRTSGVLLPIFSLPGKYGIGCFSKEAYAFVDYLKESGQRIWQILPLGPTSYGDSPYQSFSTFAGNPYFIDLEVLIDQGLLTKEECEEADFVTDSARIDYEKLYKNRFPLLRKAYQRSEIYNNPEFQHFREENAYWLRDYSLFMAVKNFFGDKSYDSWPEDIRLRYGYAMEYYQQQLYYDIEFYEYLQFEFSRQWGRLRAYANERGIRIVGDIPIYVAADSADVWAHPELFQLDEMRHLTAVAGCPPDGFSATGQLWGNPLYDWGYHRSTGYDWWVRRIQKCREMYDIVRIDHFRGFDEYYSIPADAETALNGHWEKGPGMELFHTVHARLGHFDIIAEDLGYITDSVRALVRDSGFPNMKVLEFAFDCRDSSGPIEYLPHNYQRNCVVYTGTHDNETLVEWLGKIRVEEIAMIQEYTGRNISKKTSLADAIIRLAHASVADTCIIPIQDYLGLGEDARINKPSVIGVNWMWRLKDGQLSANLQKKMLYYTNLYGRNW
ncbi:MAG: 4-alpha-glucanotransferase [Lachnospiraceae bacterium]|nr:4-alpha-glucanotransferase [Lachnospiraceae bacterium]